MPHGFPKNGDGPNTVLESTVRAPNSVSFSFPHRVPGRELSEFLANSPSLLQNSVSSLFRSSALDQHSARFLKGCLKDFLKDD